MTRRWLLAALVTTLAALPLRAHAQDGLVVLAAASLTESLSKVAAAWTAKGNPPVTLSFDASSRLAKQVEAGASADLFFSADTAWMDWLAARGLVAPGTRRELFANTLVVVAPAGSPLVLRAPADLGAPAVRHLALAGESVPAGRYARAALTALGAWEAVASRVVNGDNVRTVLGWVAKGEAEAGVVYATDAKVEPRVRVAYTFPAGSHPSIVYPAAVTAGARKPKEAVDFLAFCASAEGRAVFAAAGFGPAGK